MGRGNMVRKRTMTKPSKQERKDTALDAYEEAEATARKASTEAWKAYQETLREIDEAEED